MEVVHPEIIDFESEDTERRIAVEIAMQWTNAYSESVHTYANTISTTEGGTHEEGFRAAMTSLINRYAREKGILKEKDENLTGDDIREGLTAVISIKLGEPQFEGQTKTKLGNTEAKTFVQRVVNEQLGDWLDSHPNEARDVIRKSIQAAAARMAARKAREATRRKGLLESGGMPGKLRDCQSNRAEECEVFIVEGDSAGGSAVRGRNPRTQAILPDPRKDPQRRAGAAGPGAGQPGGPGADHGLRHRHRRGLRPVQAEVPQDRDHGRRRRRRPAHPDPAAHAAVPVHAEPDHARARVPRAAAAVPDQVGERRRTTTCTPTVSATPSSPTARPTASGCPKDNAIQRYKGLGEMDYQELWETTMSPEHRTLLQVTLDEAAAADEIFSVLMGEDVESRRSFIQRNAKDVRFLDI